MTDCRYTNLKSALITARGAVALVFVPSAADSDGCNGVSTAAQKILAWRPPHFWRRRGWQPTAELSSEIRKNSVFPKKLDRFPMAGRQWCQTSCHCSALDPFLTPETRKEKMFEKVPLRA
jgi:hypothetical protein